MMMESVQVTSAFTNTDLASSVSKFLRSWDMTRNSEVVAIIETNHGGAAMAGEIINAMVKQHLRVRAFSKVVDGKRDINLHITHQDKEEMVSCILNNMRENRIVMADSVVSSSIGSPMDFLTEQLSKFKKVVDRNGLKYKYTGKPSNKDDLVFCLMEALYFSRVDRSRIGATLEDVDRENMHADDVRMRLARAIFERSNKTLMSNRGVSIWGQS